MIMGQFEQEHMLLFFYVLITYLKNKVIKSHITAVKRNCSNFENVDFSMYRTITYHNKHEGNPLRANQCGFVAISE